MSNFKLTKYELVKGDTNVVNGIIVTRIRAPIDMPRHGVKAGGLGGYVRSTKNLVAGAWVADNAAVFNDARVAGNARASGNAKVGGTSRVYLDARVTGNARVMDDVVLS